MMNDKIPLYAREGDKAREILEPGGKERQWCSCYEGDLDGVYKDTRKEVMDAIAAALAEEYRRGRIDEAKICQEARRHDQHSR